MGVLQPHGHFFVKAFEGCLLNDFVKKVRRRFDFVKRVKPRASRPESAEIYVLGMNLKQRI
jgi:23S rRNA (uridine2552-2'-O)-methyltransferase